MVHQETFGASDDDRVHYGSTTSTIATLSATTLVSVGVLASSTDLPP